MADIISGKDGTANVGGGEVEHLSEWSLQLGLTLNAHATNSTEGFKTRSAGTGDVTGKFKILLSDEAPTELVPGQKVAAEFHIDDSGDNYYSGDIRIGEMSGMTVDMNDGKEIAAEYSWGAMGKLTENGNVPKLAPAPAP